MALSDPRSRLRDRNGELLRTREPCLGCGALLSAHAPPTDRFCWSCAPRVDDEPPFDQALYCSKGHLRADFEEMRIDRWRISATNPLGLKRECKECHRLRNLERDRSAAGAARRDLERQERAA